MVFSAAISAAIFFIPALGAFLLLSWDAPNFWHDLFSFPSLGILLPFPTLVVAAIVTYFVEPPRTISTETSNPNYDPHNLY